MSGTLKRILPALVAAVATAVVAHVANLLAYFIGNQMQVTALGSVNGYFAVSSLFGFVVAFAIGVFGGFSRGWVAAGTGLVAGVVGAIFGSLVQVAAQGTAITGEAWAYLFQSLGSLNLVFVLAFVLAAASVGVRTARALRGRFAAEPERARKVALVRAPAQNLNDGEITHIERTAIDQDAADAQWDGYVAALEAEGWRTIEVTAAPAMADSVFIEDAVVVFGDTAVVTRPGTESRMGETAGAEEAVRALGLTTHVIQEPGTLDGGDVLKVGTTVYVGRGGRTNAAGIRQLRAILAPLGYTLVAVPMTKALHLKSAVTALPDGTVVGWADVVDDPRLFDRFLPMPEEGGAHVVVLDEETVLMASSAPQSAALIEQLGYRVVAVDIAEFEKLEGCVTCLSVRVR